MTVLVVSDALMAGNVRMLRSDSAAGSFLLGLHEKRKKVPHPGLQHVLEQVDVAPREGGASEVPPDPPPGMVLHLLGGVRPPPHAATCFY